MGPWGQRVGGTELQQIGQMDTGLSLDWGDLDPILFLLQTVLLGLRMLQSRKQRTT